MYAIYQYVLEKCHELTSRQPAMILDYGCGAGEIVEAGRKQGLEIHGTEIFYKVSRSRDIAAEKGLLGNEIREIIDGRVPFEDGTFDLVVSNHVFEHVRDLDAVLMEIHRVLKPGGVLLCLFPSREVIREGHCGIPMIHWFPRDSRFRRDWILALRKLGFGNEFGGKSSLSAEGWSERILDWLDEDVFYRNSSEIHQLFARYFEKTRHIEDDYIAFRLRNIHLDRISTVVLMNPLNYLARWFYRKMGGMVLLANKQDLSKSLST